MRMASLQSSYVGPRHAFGWSRVKHVVEWWQRTRSRHELASLDERGLLDVCMTRGTADFEASKPFWKA